MSARSMAAWTKVLRDSGCIRSLPAWLERVTLRSTGPELMPVRSSYRSRAWTGQRPGSAAWGSTTNSACSPGETQRREASAHGADHVRPRTRRGAPLVAAAYCRQCSSSTNAGDCCPYPGSISSGPSPPPSSWSASCSSPCGTATRSCSADRPSLGAGRDGRRDRLPDLAQDAAVDGTDPTTHPCSPAWAQLTSASGPSKGVVMPAKLSSLRRHGRRFGHGQRAPRRGG